MRAVGVVAVCSSGRSRKKGGCKKEAASAPQLLSVSLLSLPHCHSYFQSTIIIIIIHDKSTLLWFSFMAWQSYETPYLLAILPCRLQNNEKEIHTRPRWGYVHRGWRKRLIRLKQTSIYNLQQLQTSQSEEPFFFYPRKKLGSTTLFPLLMMTCIPKRVA